jgi:hypothetical protein
MNDVCEENDYISFDTSLGMSRGIPGYPGGLPRGSAGEAGPVPPRPLPSPDLRKTGGCCKWSQGIWVA